MLIRAGRASSTASGSTSNGSCCARKSRVSDSSTSRAMPPSWQRPGRGRPALGGRARPASAFPRRTAFAQVAKPPAVGAAAGMRARVAGGRRRPTGRWGAMSESTSEPVADGDGVIGGGEGPADSGAGAPSTPGEHDGGADGGAEGPADSGAGAPATPGEHDGGADGGAEGPADSGA